MINEEACMVPDISICKNFIYGFDVMFVDKYHELRFCRYSKPDVNIDGKFHFGINNNMEQDYISRDAALCWYDTKNHRWCMKVRNNVIITWEVIRPDDALYFKILAGIAFDEIKGSSTCRDVNDITNRIKIRYGLWFDKEVNRKNPYIVPETRNNSYRYLGKCVCGRGIRMDNSYDNLQLPIAKFVQFNGDYTTVVWQDGSHTIVKRTSGDAYDEEKAIMFATIKRMCKNNGCAMARYFDSFYKHSCDISNKKKKEKKNGSNKKANTKRNSGKA